LAWLTPFPEEYNRWRFDNFKPAWPVPHEQRRFGQFWFPFAGPTVSPVLSRYVTFFKYRLDFDDALFADIRLFESGPFAVHGDSGINVLGQRIQLDVINQPGGGPRYPVSGVEWLFTYTRLNFTGFVELGVLRPYDESTPEVFVPFGFDYGFAFSPGPELWHFDEQGEAGEDWLSDRVWQDASFAGCTEGRDVPRNQERSARAKKAAQTVSKGFAVQSVVPQRP